MDLAAFKRQLDADNEFEVSKGGITFRLCQPTEIQVRAAAARATLASNSDEGSRLAVMLSNMQPLLVRDALIGWSGVKQCHLKSGAPDEPLPFDKGFTDRVLSRWPALYDLAYETIQKRYDEHRKLLEEDEKNS